VSRIAMIGGVFLLARDPGALADWYRRHLGSQLEAMGGDTTWYEALPYRADDDPSTQRSAVFAIMPGDPGPPGTGAITNLRVDDFEAVVTSLRSAGTAIDDEVTGDDGEGSGRFARFTDPEGHRIELWQHVEGSARAAD
jgi:glyoxylase I family protein